MRTTFLRFLLFCMLGTAVICYSPSELWGAEYLGTGNISDNSDNSDNSGPGSQSTESEEDVTDVESFSLKDLLDTPITIASKSEERAVDAPSSVTVFTRKDIRDMGVTALGELLNYAPGFVVSREVEQGTASRISARGRSTTLSESVLVLMNGQRINDLYTGGVSVINRLMAVDHIKQVEIIRDPGQHFMAPMRSWG